MRHQRRAELVVADVADDVDGGAELRKVAAGVGDAAAGVEASGPTSNSSPGRDAALPGARDEVDADVTGDHGRVHAR